ncbi:MAG: calcium-binding protein [Planctomycetaceae bacterium]
MTASRRLRHASPNAELLELRTLLSSIRLNQFGKLIVEGTSESEQIQIEAVDADLRVSFLDGESQSFPASAVNLIEVRAGDGDNRVLAAGIQVPTRIYTGNGNDSITGGNGDDTITSLNGSDTIVGGPGDDRIDGGKGSDSLLGSLGNDVIDGNNGQDLIRGGRGDDTIDAGRGNDVILGQDGDDEIFTGFGTDTANGGDGADLTSPGLSSDNLLIGGRGPDTLIGRRGADTLRGGHGSDVLTGGEGDDELHGGEGRDTLIGGEGNDLLFGNSGNDILIGAQGRDALFGATGRDMLFGGFGPDSLSGGAGDDLLVPGALSDEALDQGETLQASATDLQKEWLSDRSYLQRSINLRSGAAKSRDRLNTEFLIGKNRTQAQRVFGGNFSERAIGGAGNDYFFYVFGVDTTDFEDDKRGDRV